MAILVIFVASGCNSSKSTVTQLAAPGGITPQLPESKTEREAHEYFVNGHKLRAKGKLDESAEMFQTAYETLSESDSDHARGSLANEYGLALLKTDRPTESIPVLQAALHANEQANDQVGIGVSNLNLGDAFSRTGDRAAAESHWSTARRVAERSGNSSLAAAASQRMGDQIH